MSFVSVTYRIPSGGGQCQLTFDKMSSIIQQVSHFSDSIIVWGHILRIGGGLLQRDFRSPSRIRHQTPVLIPPHCLLEARDQKLSIEQSAVTDIGLHRWLHWLQIASPGMSRCLKQTSRAHLGIWKKFPPAVTTAPRQVHDDVSTSRRNKS